MELVIRVARANGHRRKEERGELRVRVCVCVCV